MGSRPAAAAAEVCGAAAAPVWTAAADKVGCATGYPCGLAADVVVSGASAEWWSPPAVRGVIPEAFAAALMGLEL